MFRLFLVACISMCLSPSLSFAQQNVSVTASVPLEGGFMGGCKNDRPRKKSVTDQALKQAKNLVIKNYASGFNQSKASAYMQKQNEILQNIDGYLLGFNVTDQYCNEDARVFSLSIRAIINETAINSLLGSMSGAKNVGRSQKSLMVTMFVAREVENLQQYDAKVFKRIDQDNFKSETDTGTTSGSGAEVISAENSSQSFATGGSTTQKSDKIDYVVSDMGGDLDSTVSKVLTQGGFRVAASFAVQRRSDGLFDIAAMKEDFGSANEISPENLDNAAMALQQLNVPYFAVATLDIGSKKKDPVTGNFRVTVSVTGQVYQVDGFLPEVVASVGPVQYSALGPDQTVARRNALSLAAEKATGEIVDTLNVAGIY
jgi:hypothetical protein